MANLGINCDEKLLFEKITFLMTNCCNFTADPILLHKIVKSHAHPFSTSMRHSIFHIFQRKKKKKKKCANSNRGSICWKVHFKIFRWICWKRVVTTCFSYFVHLQYTRVLLLLHLLQNKLLKWNFITSFCIQYFHLIKIDSLIYFILFGARNAQLWKFLT